ncbi:MAG: tRNA (N6-isopentenyl adenosine(37)-C2)-methylthiotransferase MiaB [bacterium]|nr:tRNA (N6-isopentenyl adenosine(37)-C2)-methylthiotransferase MiaB [bacterium]
MEKRVHVKSYGCQMNVYDSDRMLDILASLGYQSAEEFGQADLVILNTCHIREKASEKVFSDLGRLKKIQEARRSGGRDLMIGVAGCVAQAEGEEIQRRAPYVDMVFGPQVYHRLPQFLAKAQRARELTPNRPSKYLPGVGVLDVDFPTESKFDHLVAPRANGVTSFLSIQEGCDKFCHFCVVPYTRGAETSRPVQDILRETKALVDQGVKEVSLLGQNVNAYHGEGVQGGIESLSSLLQILSEVKGVERLRYVTSHPRDMTAELIRAHAEIPQVMPYLHLPIQSGSDRILKAMNRGHTADDYRRIIEDLRSARPNICLSSDFIVGYPGETDEDFEETLALIREIVYAQSYSFKYSPRPGTPAAAMEKQVEESVKSERLTRLQELLSQQQKDFNASLIGTVQPVLVEKDGREKGQKIGLSPYLQATYFDDDTCKPGDIVQVQIEESGLKSLGGTLVT